MGYFDLVLSDPYFAELFIGGLFVFGIFGAWRFFVLYIVLVFITFTQPVVMQHSMILLAAVMSSHYLLASLAALFSNEQKSPFKDVT